MRESRSHRSAAGHRARHLGPVLGAVLGLATALLVLPPAGLAQEGADASPPAPKLTIESVTVEPASPGPDTLCRLRVKLQNAGPEIASQLDFGVKINGQELGVYGNQLFMFPVPAGGSDELALYNFWSTETSRPAPKDGKLTVEVTLKGAQWMQIGDEDGVEVWTPLGPVESLPQAASVTLAMSG